MFHGVQCESKICVNVYAKLASTADIVHGMHSYHMQICLCVTKVVAAYLVA